MTDLDIWVKRQMSLMYIKNKPISLAIPVLSEGTVSAHTHTNVVLVGKIILIKAIQLLGIKLMILLNLKSIHYTPLRPAQHSPSGINLISVEVIYLLRLARKTSLTQKPLEEKISVLLFNESGSQKLYIALIHILGHIFLKQFYFI